jgi:hypothetical protein
VLGKHRVAFTACRLKILVETLKKWVSTEFVDVSYTISPISQRSYVASLPFYFNTVYMSNSRSENDTLMVISVVHSLR